MKKISKMLGQTEKADQKSQSEKTCCIRELIPAKLAYFLQYAVMGITLPYFNPFFVDIGLAMEQAGYVNGFRALFPLATSPLIGLLTDYTKSCKLVLVTLFIFNVSVFFSAPWLASLLTEENLTSDALFENTTCVNTTYNNKTYSDGNAINGKFTNGTLMNNEINRGHYEKSNSGLFALIFNWAVLLAITGYPTIALIDLIVMQLVSQHENQTSYGIQRLFAPIGYTVGTFLAGAMIDVYKSKPFLTKYTAIFFCQVPFGILSCINVCFFNTNKTKSETSGKRSMRFLCRELIKTFQELRMIMFFVTVVLLGIGYTLINGYLVLYLEKELDTPKTVTGLILAVSSLCQIAVFPCSAQLQKLVGGAYPCFILALFSYFTRFLLFSLIKNYWLALPIQLLESTGFALFWAAAVEFIHKNTSKQVAVTMFNFTILAYYNVANAISNVGGGEIYQHHGGRILFQIMASLCGIWGSIMTVWLLFARREKFSGVRKSNYLKRKISLGNPFLKPAEISKTENIL